MVAVNFNMSYTVFLGRGLLYAFFPDTFAKKGQKKEFTWLRFFKTAVSPAFWSVHTYIHSNCNPQLTS